jgi:hypothetical protein
MGSLYSCVDKAYIIKVKTGVRTSSYEGHVALWKGKNIQSDSPNTSLSHKDNRHK